MEEANDNSLSDDINSKLPEVDTENNEVKPDSNDGNVDSTSDISLQLEKDKAEFEALESEVFVSQRDKDLENEVYNITDDLDATSNIDNNTYDNEFINSSPNRPAESNADDTGDDEQSNERASKRPMAVITIDSDSDDSSICHVDSYQATASEAKKMRKGYSSSESETESSSDESDYDSDDAIVIIGVPSSVSLNGGTVKKRANNLDIGMNECFSSEHLNEEFLSHWSKGESFNSKNLTLHCDPFQICILNDFLDNPDAICNVVDDMNTLDWSRRTMDLYEFHRTTDLRDLTWQRSIKSMYELLKNNVMKWVARMTNTNLTHVSASCALYGPGDHLLVHDDLLEDRKIAFIFYMSPWNVTSLKESDEDTDEANGTSKESESADDNGWLKSMGGELQFLSSDDKGQPTVVVKSLLPQNNTFAFFKVGTKSFHQVAEVTTYDYPRLTINGWFHGPPEPNEQATKNDEEVESSDAYNTVHPPNTDVFQQTLNDWITSIYLSPKCKYQIVQKFEETSEISLVNYFIQQKYDEVLLALRSEHLSWVDCGPINLRNYENALNDDVIAKESLAPLLELQTILTCKYFVTLLQGYTGLAIQSYCRFEIQRWTAGKYTVLPIKGEYSASEVDVIIYLGCPDRFLKGGTITYLLPEEADADPVISVGLKNNALNIVYSEAGLARFTKYVSKLSLKEGEYFYMLVCSYRNPEIN